MDALLSNKAQHLQVELDGLAPRHALRAIVRACEEGLITEREAVWMAHPELLDGVLYAGADLEGVSVERVLARHSLGMPGAATGQVALSVEAAQAARDAGQPYILVLKETRPEHMPWIEQAAGLITFEGGMTSHAAIIARQKGKPALIGTGVLSLKQGERITLDGAAGMVVAGEAAILPPEPDFPALQSLLAMAEGLSSEVTHKMTVKANADTPQDAAKARALGAKGIGVVRTEHMFFGEDRLPHMQAMIFALTPEERRQALDRLFPMQKADFKGILAEMSGLPVTVRLLDAPLHEFLPEDQSVLAHETHPMLGNRAVRLGLQHPEIFEMQVRAILEAATELTATDIPVFPQIMVPLVADREEVRAVQAIVARVAADVALRYGEVANYAFGIMTELPAACVMASEMAEHADFFSFGTNDLTQTTLGFSRDDTGEVVTRYLQQEIFERDPFQSLHPAVANMIGIATALGKEAKPGLDVSICGEHGGDPFSIHLAQRLKVDAVSVSPPRVPVARLVAAQAMLGHEQQLLEEQASLEALRAEPLGRTANDGALNDLALLALPLGQKTVTSLAA